MYSVFRQQHHSSTASVPGAVTEPDAGARGAQLQSLHWLPLLHLLHTLSVVQVRAVAATTGKHSTGGALAVLLFSCRWQYSLSWKWYPLQAGCYPHLPNIAITFVSTHIKQYRQNKLAHFQNCEEGKLVDCSKSGSRMELSSLTQHSVDKNCSAPSNVISQFYAGRKL